MKFALVQEVRGMYSVEIPRDFWRYLFAGLATQGLIIQAGEDFGMAAIEKGAAHSVLIADALLAALESKEKA